MEVDESKQAESAPPINPVVGPVKPARGRPPGSRSQISASKLAQYEASSANSNGTKAVPGESVGAGVFNSLDAQSRINGRPPRLNRRERILPQKMNPDKPILTLSVAASILDLHPRTLRIYEEQGLVVPYRTKTQRRLYSQNDIKRFQFIQFLTRQRGVNLNGVKIILLMLEELRKTLTDPVHFIFPDYDQVEIA